MEVVKLTFVKPFLTHSLLNSFVSMSHALKQFTCRIWIRSKTSVIRIWQAGKFNVSNRIRILIHVFVALKI